MCYAPILHDCVKRGVGVWPSVHAVCVVTASGYNDIFMVIRMSVVLSELDLFDRGGSFGFLLIIPVGYRPFFPTRGEAEEYWPIGE